MGYFIRHLTLSQGRLVASVACAACVTILLPGRATAQDLIAADEAETSLSQTPLSAPAPGEWTNPWKGRPVCASMFLSSDWQLTPKQQACNWVNNGVFSTNAMLAAIWSAEWSIWTDAPSQQGDGFALRFGRNFVQNAAKSSGQYLGSVLAREDPRTAPPYLALRTTPPASGFFKRTTHAIGRNVVTTQCVSTCTSEKDIHNRFMLSAPLGSIASGAMGEVLTTDHSDSINRALRGTASAYAATFVNALFVEFKPELSAFGGRVFRLFGGR